MGRLIFDERCRAHPYQRNPQPARQHGQNDPLTESAFYLQLLQEFHRPQLDATSESSSGSSGEESSSDDDRSHLAPLFFRYNPDSSSDDSRHDLSSSSSSSMDEHGSDEESDVSDMLVPHPNGSDSSSNASNSNSDDNGSDDSNSDHDDISSSSSDNEEDDVFDGDINVVYRHGSHVAVQTLREWMNVQDARRALNQYLQSMDEQKSWL